MVCFKDTMVMHIPIILAVKVSTLLIKGWRGHLTYVMDTKKVSSELEKVLIVRDFSMVFPKELNGLPSWCDVKFMIELEVNTALISKV